jgi:pimeloyl-ACP methyl ester carboxylesterase
LSGRTSHAIVHETKPAGAAMAVQSATDKLPLVLVPGLLCTGDLFAAQVEALSASRACMIADHTTADTLPAIAAGILANAPPRFALAGLSMGGYIAFEMLRQAPERITKLALLDSNARADRPDQVKTRHVLMGAARSVGVRSVQGMLLKFLIHPDRLADRGLTARVLLMADGIGVAAFIRQQLAILGRPDNRPFLSHIKCPTVIVVGAEDALTPVKVAEEMHAGIAGSTLHVIPACGHLATMEAPAAVTTILRQWLA